MIPEVNLPDGVTSTSLVSQSEMVQFVTNTLDTWLVGLMDRVKKASEDTIYGIRPLITTFHKVVRKIPVYINMPDNIPQKPIISVEKGS